MSNPLRGLPLLAPIAVSSVGPVTSDDNCCLVVCLPTGLQLTSSVPCPTQSSRVPKSSSKAHRMNEGEQPGVHFQDSVLPFCPKAAFLFEMKSLSRLNTFLEPHLIGQLSKHRIIQEKRFFPLANISSGKMVSQLQSCANTAKTVPQACPLRGHL